jgi:hypothetical protein
MNIKINKAMKKLFAFMVLVAIVLTGCNRDKITNLDEKIIGKWMVADKDGKPAMTNEKMVITFLSASKAKVSASLNTNHPEVGLWIDQQDADVVIKGDKVTLTFHADAHSTSVHEFTVTSINDNEFVAKQKVTVTVDGNEVISEEGTFRFVRVTADYRQDILGLWEGRMTSEESEFGDNDVHRWEYLADGTHRFYHKEGNTWVPSDDEYAEYFVDGNMLFTLWKNNGDGAEERREHWEISSIENGVMNWTALRRKADGTTYTATYTMTKVEGEDPVDDGEYVDLGLPSGTLWKTTNETNPNDPGHDFYTFDEAVAAFGNKLPTNLQLQELIDECEWTFDDEQNIAILTGPNGNTIVLPRKGKRATNGVIYYDGSDGNPAGASYWSGTAIDATYAWRLDSGGFASGVYMYDGNRGAGASIRLVK